jgi:hypothetical protein
VNWITVLDAAIRRLIDGSVLVLWARMMSTRRHAPATQAYNDRARAAKPGEMAMIGREFRKRLRLLQGRSETITTRFELTDAGRLVEHISLETHDRRTGRADKRLVPVDRRRDSKS